MDMAVLEALKCAPVETAYNVGAVVIDADGQVISRGYSREIAGRMKGVFGANPIIGYMN